MHVFFLFSGKPYMIHNATVKHYKLADKVGPPNSHKSSILFMNWILQLQRCIVK